MVSTPGPSAATSAPACVRTLVASAGAVVRSVTRSPDAAASRSWVLASAITRPRPAITRWPAPPSVNRACSSLIRWLDTSTARPSAARVPVLTIKQSIPQGASPATIAQIQADSRGQVIRAAATVVGLVGLSLAVGWLIAGRFLWPLRTITATAQDISASSLDRRVALGHRDDEFSDLGKTLDGLFGRLEASFESQRRFVANASHELRTPLAAERTLIQVTLADPDADARTLRAACEELLVLGEQQERLIEALLTLACGERGVDRWDRFDLAELAGKVIADRAGEAERRGVRVQAALGAAPATGDPSLAES